MKISLLSVIIPCFNEEATITEIVNEVKSVDLEAVKKEIIIIDDYSTDGTRKILSKIVKQDKSIKLLLQPSNQGKGMALKRGIAESTGDIVIIQDADREYNPHDYIKLMRVISEDRGDIVFGSRFIGSGPTRVAYLANRIANKFMSRFSAMLNGLYVSDLHTCYIMFKGSWIRQQSKTLRAKRFGFNPEIVARIAKNKKHLRICEVGIAYNGRTKNEGKKIAVTDGVKALWEIFYFNVFR